jgi:hypothetical protein
VRPFRALYLSRLNGSKRLSSWARRCATPPPAQTPFAARPAPRR